MKSKRGQLKSRKCGPGCSEKQYSEIRQPPVRRGGFTIPSPRPPTLLTPSCMIKQRPSPVGALHVIRQALWALVVWKGTSLYPLWKRGLPLPISLPGGPPTAGLKPA